MRMTPDLEASFNTQITLEFASAMVYHQLAAAMGAIDMPGAEAWLRRQANEEVEHAQRFIAHLVDRGNTVSIGDIAAPGTAPASMLDAFAAALDHEAKVSAAIRELVATAESAGDLHSRPLLDWFLDEQIEEEATVGEIVSHLELVGKDGSGLLRIDDRLATEAGEADDE